jgi:MFS family permease
MAAVMTGLFHWVHETGLGTASAGFVALGMVGLAVFSKRWWPMVASTLVWSIGGHLIMPARDSVAISLAHEGRQGRRLGQLGLVSTFAAIGGYGVVYVGTRFLHGNYPAIFWAGAVAGVLAVFLWLGVPQIGGHEERPRLVFKRRYSLFYWLSFFFGARKQVFITFGPWVLVRVFKQPAYVLAQLGTVGAVLGLVFQPWLGHMIDRHGERVVTMADACCLGMCCLGYGGSQYLIGERLGRPGLALAVVCFFFVADQMLFAVQMTRTTYLSKIIERQEDMTPSLSLGVSINHLVSMSLPTLGGVIWQRYGYQWVFVGAAGVAMMIFVAGSRIWTPQHPKAAA